MDRRSRNDAVFVLGLMVGIFVAFIGLFLRHFLQPAAGDAIANLVASVVLLGAFVAMVCTWYKLARSTRFSGHFQPATAKAQDLAWKLNQVRYMNGTQFEHFVASLFRSLGYRATALDGAGDQGVDIVLKRGDETIAVQCKNYAMPVGNRPVQEVYAGARHHGCPTAWVIAPEGFTKGAVEIAQSVVVSLHNGWSLREWIQQIDKSERSQRAPLAEGPLSEEDA